MARRNDTFLSMPDKTDWGIRLTTLGFFLLFLLFAVVFTRAGYGSALLGILGLLAPFVGLLAGGLLMYLSFHERWSWWVFLLGVACVCLGFILAVILIPLSEV